jgi:putative holliday junction resolvase
MTLWLGLDVGTCKLGVSIGQTITQTASPLITLQVKTTWRQKRPCVTLRWLALDAIVKKWAPSGWILGYPYYPTFQKMHRLVVWYEHALKQRYQLPVYLEDEGYSTYDVRALSKNNPTIDGNGFAAMTILERWLMTSGYTS